MVCKCSRGLGLEATDPWGRKPNAKFWSQEAFRSNGLVDGTRNIYVQCGIEDHTGSCFLNFFSIWINIVTSCETEKNKGS